MIAKIDKLFTWLVPDLPIGVLGKADAAGCRDPLEARSDVDAVTHEVAVALLDDVAQMNADAKFDALVGRDPCIALDHGVLHFECAAHGIDHAPELDDAAVTGALDDAAVMHGEWDRSDRCARRAVAPEFDLRPHPRAGYSRRRRRPVSLLFSVSRLWRALTSSTLAQEGVPDRSPRV